MCIRDRHPADCFKPIDAANAGLGAVLRLLYLADQPVTAGTISEKLHVSTARVAVLLKKLVAKGLVTKGRDPVDARVTVVALTPLGAQTVQDLADHMHQQVGLLIDQIGEARLLDFIRTAQAVSYTHLIIGGINPTFRGDLPMKQLVIGVLAHVDAGKTTLSEALLYTAGAIPTLGRVDHRDAYLDTHDLERARGITIFSKQALFRTEGMAVTLLDTPGHVDFSTEMERTLQVLDYAILVISATDGVQAHTCLLYTSSSSCPPCTCRSG